MPCRTEENDTRKDGCQWKREEGQVERKMNMSEKEKDC